MKILVVIASVDPEGGGPTEVVEKRGLRLQQLGHRVEVLTLDDPRQGFLKTYPLPFHALGPSRTGYCYNRALLPWLRAHAHEYDAVIVEGLWQYPGLATWRALRGTTVPYYIFVHGMLDPWFKRRYPLKHIKKWLYWPWAEYRVLRDARAVLFTADQERLLARESFWLYRAHERVVAYGTSPPPGDAAGLRERFLAAHPQLRGRRLLLFLGRIHEKKGCDLLIRALARVAAIEPALHLVMAGPDQTGWVARLQQLASDVGVADRICWPGMLRHESKWGALYSAEALALPSHQENFGIVVAEALACGVPALISNKVNIWSDIEADGAGLVESDTLAGTEALMRRWLALDADTRGRMSRQARRTFSARYGIDAMATSLLQVLLEPAANHPGP
jgi:glycosyltransferase involved in cell wall biosynthesis